MVAKKEVVMAAIIPRKRNDGMRYIALLGIKRNGKVIFRNQKRLLRSLQQKYTLVCCQEVRFDGLE